MNYNYIIKMEEKICDHLIKIKVEYLSKNFNPLLIHIKDINKKKYILRFNFLQKNLNIEKYKFFSFLYNFYNEQNIKLDDDNENKLLNFCKDLFYKIEKQQYFTYFTEFELLDTDIMFNYFNELKRITVDLKNDSYKIGIFNNIEIENLEKVKKDLNKYINDFFIFYNIELEEQNKELIYNNINIFLQKILTPKKIYIKS